MADTPNFEVTLDLDQPMPSHELYVSVPAPGKIGIRVSPGVEAWTLAVLRPEIGLAVADSIRAHRETSSCPPTSWRPAGLRSSASTPRRAAPSRGRARLDTVRWHG